MKTRIIAEIGENHMGRLPLAERMIQEAAIAGAQVVKFQSYRGKDFPESDPERSWFEQVELSDEAHVRLMECSRAHGVEFMSSPFSKERTEFLIRIGVKKVKVASGVMLNSSILSALNGASDRLDEVIVSTGLATLDEISHTVKSLNRIRKVTILHCTTQYPCADVDANLLAIRALKDKFPSNEIGYSDHTLGTEACLAAVALGASTLEKHFTLNHQWREGTDHALSADPIELKKLVDACARIEKMLGDGKKEPRPAEREIREFVRNRFPG